MVKSATFGGPFAKMMTRRIVCREVVLLRRRTGSLLQECHHAWVSRHWAALGHHGAHVPVPHAGPSGRIRLRSDLFFSFQVFANLASKLKL